MFFSTLGEVSYVVRGWYRGNLISNMKIEVEMTDTFVANSKMGQTLERNLSSRMVSMYAVENSYDFYGLSKNGKTGKCALQDQHSMSRRGHVDPEYPYNLTSARCWVVP